MTTFKTNKKNQSKRNNMKKVKIKIKSFLNDSILFEYESEGNTIKKTLEEAIRKNADLSYADLSSADLSYANLRSADLRSADLRSANLRSADLSSAYNIDIWWHVHHNTLYEQLTEPIRNRINYVKESIQKK